MYLLKARYLLSWSGVIMNAVCIFVTEIPYNLNMFFYIMIYSAVRIIFTML